MVENFEENIQQENINDAREVLQKIAINSSYSNSMPSLEDITGENNGNQEDGEMVQRGQVVKEDSLQVNQKDK